MLEVNEEMRKDEYIEISITDILCRLWHNKIIFIIVLIISLLAGGYFLTNKNYNQYNYKATISYPINFDGSVLMNVDDINLALPQ